MARRGGRGAGRTGLWEAVGHRLPGENALTHRTVFILSFDSGATPIVRPPAQPNSNMLPALYTMSSVAARTILNRIMFVLEITMIITHAALRHRCGRG
jgi:hypothetical protein